MLETRLSGELFFSDLVVIVQVHVENRQLIKSVTYDQKEPKLAKPASCTTKASITKSISSFSGIYT